MTQTINERIYDGNANAPTPKGEALAGSSTTTALDNGQTFTGAWVDVAGHDSVIIAIATDQNGTYQLQFSPDGTNADSTLSWAYDTTRINAPKRLTITRRYVRVVFTNDSGSNQTYLRLQTLVGSKAPLAVALNGTVAQDYDCLMVRTVSEAITIPRGLVQGYSNNTKFGANPDIDTAAAEDVWNGGGDYTGFPTGAAETVEAFSDDAADTSAGTGARTLRLVGLDANFVEQTVDVTLSGVTPVVTTETWARLSRMYVLTAGSGAENAGLITARHTTTTANVFAAMPAGDNQTLIAATTVPANKVMIIRRVAAQLGRNQASGAADISVRAREEGSVFRKRRQYTVAVGDGIDRHYEGGMVLPEKTDVKIRVEGVTANNTAITGEFEYYLADAA